MLKTDVAILGAGHSGLAMSHELTQRGIEHLVLERGEVGERWRSERWPSLRLLTPNWMNKLPASAKPLSSSDGFMTRDDFRQTLVRAAETAQAPVLTQAGIDRLSRSGDRFHLQSRAGVIEARSVIIATGACDRAAVPAWAADLSRSIASVTTTGYAGPDQLPEGGVLVVGASASGVQLAAEIHASGRPVTLAVGRHVRAPRRYRGRDLMTWLAESGFLLETRPGEVDPRRLMSQPSLQLVGNDAGQDLGLAELVQLGVRVVGRAVGAQGGLVRFAPTLALECEAAERRRGVLLSAIDHHVAQIGAGAPPSPEAWLPASPLPEAPDEIDLKREGIRTVLWAAGYRRNYGWLDIPILDGEGEILNDGGVTPVPGLFVLGLPFMRHRASSFIFGAVRDARALCEPLQSHLGQTSRRAA